MTRFSITLGLSTVLFVSAFAAPAFAAAAQAPKPEQGATRQHAYWLSRDLQRLVFWQAPGARDTRR